MGFHNNVYIGHVETINPNATVSEKFIVSKVVALKLVGFNNNKKTSTYRPLRKYKEYYKIISVEPILGLVSDAGIDKALRKDRKSVV